jgi:hypothetical protein
VVSAFDSEAEARAIIASAHRFHVTDVANGLDGLRFVGPRWDVPRGADIRKRERPVAYVFSLPAEDITW